MPLPVPNLDDHTWKDLVDEGRSLIPAWAPQWTNYNPSDPGITLLEMFAFLSEMMLYRLNRISDANVIQFLKLINGPDWRLVEPLDDARRSTLIALARVRRAVTAKDFEELCLSLDDTADDTAKASQEEKVARVICLPGHDLPGEWGGATESDTSSDVSVVVLSDRGGEPGSELLHKLRQLLDRARLLCTKVHVLGPRYVTVRVRITLKLRPNCLAESVRHSATQALIRFFDPLHGGLEGRGWPFGRDVYLSELYQLLSGLPGVESVIGSICVQAAHGVQGLSAAPEKKDRERRNRLDEVEAIDLGPGELVNAQIAAEDIAIVTAKEQRADGNSN